MSVRVVELKRGVSALVWFRVFAGSFVYFLATMVFTAVVSLGPWGSHFTYPGHPVAATWTMVTMFTGIVLLVVMTFPMAVRAGAERMRGYTTLPFSNQQYDLADRKSGEIIRPAGQAPLRTGITFSLKAERARAAGAAAGSPPAGGAGGPEGAA